MARQLAIVLTGFALFWYAVNVPAQQVRISKSAANGNISETQSLSTQYVGGFPWKYCEFQQNSSVPLSDKKGRIYRFQSSVNWCWNMVLGIAIAAILALVLWYASRKRDAREEPKSGRMQLSLSSLLIIVTIFASVLGYYRIGQQRFVDDMDAFAHSGGSCKVVMDGPKWLGDAIDLSFVMKLQRATINRAECTDAQFERIAKMRSLSSIAISHASPSDIEVLAKLPNVSALSISDCKLTDGILSAIRTNPMISSLSFRNLQSAPTTEQISALHDIVVNSDHDWSLSLPVFPKVPLRLENMPQLRFLSLQPIGEGRRNNTAITNVFPVADFPASPPSVRPAIDDSEQVNVVEDLSVTLSDLPRLVRVAIDGAISRLTIKNAPALSHLAIPDQVSERLELEDLPCLFRLDLGLVRFPDEIKLSDLPTLLESTHVDAPYGQPGIVFSGRLTEPMIKSLGDYAKALVGVRSMTMEALVAWLPNSKATRLDFNSIRIERNSESTDFSSLPDLDKIESVRMPQNFMVGREFKPTSHLYPLLAKLPNLRELHLDDGFTDNDARYLSRLAKLEIFVAMNSKMTDNGWAQLPVMPNLRGVFVPQQITRLTFRNLPNLESVFWEHAALKSLTLENLPRLGTKVQIDAESRLEAVSIKNLREVDLELDRMPERFEIADTPLVYVIAGGEWLTDEELPKIVSPETVKLDITETAISSKSVDRLVALKKLRLLDVSATNLEDADIQRLIAETDIGKLEVRNLELSDETIDALPEGQTIGLPRGSRWSISIPMLMDLSR